MTHRLRHRRRVARLIVRAHTARSAIGRELCWLARDLRDLRAELDRYRDRMLERIADPSRALADDELRRQHEDLSRREAELERRLRSAA